MGALSWRGQLPVKVVTLMLAGALIDSGDLVAAMLRLYSYHPGLLPNPVADARLGALLADALFVPVLTACTLAVFRRNRLQTSLLLALLFAVIEEYFVRRGIFIRLGWRLWYTPALFLGYCVILSWWSSSFEATGYTRFHRTVVLLSMLQHLWAVTALALSGVLNLYTFRPHWLRSPDLDNVLGGALLQLLPFLLVACVFIWYRWVDNPVLFAAAVLIWVGWTAFLQNSGVRQDAHAWGPVQAGMSMGVLLWVAGRVDAWLADPYEKAGVRL